MPSLPEGTITLLFTDIESSTRLLELLGERYAAVLADYRTVLRAAFRELGGQEVDSRGDESFFAFSRASDAVLAAVAAQRALANHAWPEGHAVRARMGMHTGEVDVAEGGYVGLGIHLAVRISSVGHGGQVLLSGATRALVQDELPARVSMKDLGQHWLKDFAAPEHIYQLVIPDLPFDFPPLRSLKASPSNLPVQLTTFVGRQRELAEIKRLMGTTRLLTLTGPGGSGKTRLALRVAADLVEKFADGTSLVDLAPLTNPAFVTHGVAAAVGISEQPGRALMATLVDYLQAKEALLILDNCEHLVTACAQLTEQLLRTCPELHILVTSREILGVAGETNFPVPPLALPDPRRLPPLKSLMEFEAVKLFTERATSILPTFQLTDSNAVAVAELCLRLDGIPLAIELAAARVRVLTAEEIAGKLNDRFKLLTGGSRTALPRHQTLRAAIDWSFDLLPRQEQVLLRRLSVFAAGFTLEAVEAICADGDVERIAVLDLLARCADKSLVMTQAHNGQSRYRLLETIREYCLDRLHHSGELDDVNSRHRDWYLRLVEAAEPELWGRDQVAWLERLEREYDNLRAAMEWSLETGQVHTSLRFAGALSWYWFLRARFVEGRKWVEQALAIGNYATASARAKALYGLALLAWGQTDYEHAAKRAEESLRLYKALGDKSGVASAISLQGHIAVGQGNYSQAAGLLREGLILFRELGHIWGIAYCTDGLGFVALHEGDLDAAVALWKESLARSKELRSTGLTAYSLHSLGLAEHRRGEFAAATALYEESLVLYREVGDKRGSAVVLMRLGTVMQAEERYERAKDFHEQSLALRREIGDKRGIANSINNLGVVARCQGDYERARTLHKESMSLYQEVEDESGIADCFEGLGGIALATGQPERAARLLGAAEALREAVRPALLFTGVPMIDYGRAVAAINAELGESASKQAWAEGRAMTLARAVEYARRSR